MDSATLESLSDTSTLPELSFEDLLDQSPIKKFTASLFENDVLEETDRTEKDETLNTPVAKRKLPQDNANQTPILDELTEMLTLTATSVTTMETSNDEKKTNVLCTPTPPTTPKTTIPLAVAAAAAAEEPTTSTTAVSVVTRSDGNTSNNAPVLLNSKIALSKMNITPQTVVKIATTSKTISTTSTSLSASTIATISASALSPESSSTSTPTTAKATLGTVTTIDGKTALKTASGQIVYIQKGQPKAVSLAVSGNTANTPTAVRIKTSTTLPNTIATSASTNMTAVKVTPVANSASSGSNTKILTTATANIGGNKTVIQLIRSADGKLVPLKTATAAGKSTLTLSPTVAAQFAGKKLITTTGGQIVLKAASTAIAASPLKQPISTSANNTATESIVTTAKPIKIQKIMTPSSSIALGNQTTQQITPTTIAGTKLTATTISSATVTENSDETTASTTTTTQPISVASPGGGKIYVHGTQIVVPSSQLIKLSPKLAGATTTSTTGAIAVTKPSGSSGNNNTTNSGTPISGALHAIHIPGKQGLQYVRVFTAPKKPSTTSSTTSTAATAATTSIAASAKVLNSVPPKFTVVRPSPASKIILTKSPKSDGTPVLSPIAAGKVKTLVTVPTIRTLSSSDCTLASSSSVVTSVSTNKSIVTPSCTTSPTATTTATNIASSSGILRPKTKISEINSEIQRMTASAGEEKKVVCGPDGKRYLVMPRSMLRTAQTAGIQHRLVSGISGQQQKQQPQLHNQPQRSAPQPKVYSVVKTATNCAALAAASVSEGGMKSFIICKSQQGGSSVKAIQVKRPAAQQLAQSQPRLPSQQKEEEEVKKIPTITSTATTTVQSNNNKFVPIKIKQEPLDSDDLTSLMFSDEALVRGGVRRKHCNCSKSQCLKLYCDCFANGEFCQDCTCKDCFNNLQYEDERQRAIKSCLERNPSAFKPKITTSSDQGDTRLHNKGCNCKRSGCLKNYCECFEAKIPCSSNCKCVGCRNVEDRPDLDMDPIDPKLLESIANASNATNTIARAVSTSNQGTFAGGIRRSYDKAFPKKELKSESDNLDENDQRDGRKRTHSDDDFTGTAALLASPQLGDGAADDANLPAEKRSTNFITQEVIDATIQCMISQADECLKNSLPAHQIEKMVLEELGRCLVEIIDFSIRNTDNSFSQN